MVSTPPCVARNSPRGNWELAILADTALMSYFAAFINS